MVHSPVIIIGAPRSGTNILRDMLVKLHGVGTWPCDEINYIWRHGNVQYPSDEFTTEMATANVQSYIRDKFQKIATAGDLDTVIEKTCANSLRVGFVNKVIADAKYVFIVRNGIDAAGSALHRWRGSLDIQYVLKKARYVPATDLPYYASRYLVNQLYRWRSRESRLSFWGPAMENMEELLENYSLEEVCALQWQACVDNAERDFTALSSSKIFRIKYEEFVTDPVVVFEQLAGFLDKEMSNHVCRCLRENINNDSIGKGRNALGQECVSRITSLIGPTLERYGYE